MNDKKEDSQQEHKDEAKKEYISKNPRDFWVNPRINPKEETDRKTKNEYRDELASFAQKMQWINDYNARDEYRPTLVLPY